MSSPYPKRKIYRGDFDDEQYAYSKSCFEVITFSEGTQAILLRVVDDPVGFIRWMASQLSGEAFVLYVLLDRGEPGRYQSSPKPQADILQFLDRFGEALVGGCYHNLWLYWPNYLQLIYDQHDNIYLYGHIETLRAELTEFGLDEGSVEPIPFPHIHRYWPEYESVFEDILAHWDWQRTDLHDSDNP